MRNRTRQSEVTPADLGISAARRDAAAARRRATKLRRSSVVVFDHSWGVTIPIGELPKILKQAARIGTEFGPACEGLFHVELVLDSPYCEGAAVMTRGKISHEDALETVRAYFTCDECGAVGDAEHHADCEDDPRNWSGAR